MAGDASVTADQARAFLAALYDWRTASMSAVRAGELVRRGRPLSDQAALAEVERLGAASTALQALVDSIPEAGETMGGD